MSVELDKRFAPLEPFIVISEVDTAKGFAEHIFQRKYGSSAPDIPRHFVAFYRSGDGCLTPTTYLHAWKFGKCYMVGGACTDGGAIRKFHPEHQAIIAQSPGIFYFTLRYLFKKLELDCTAFFGYCGDQRALEVDLEAGFRLTSVDKVLIHTPRRLPKLYEWLLMRSVAKLGPF